MWNQLNEIYISFIYYQFPIFFSKFNNRSSFLECKDDPTWKDNDERTCMDYKKEGDCKNGFANKFGSKYKYPELHCCECGKLGKGNYLYRNINLWYGAFHFILLATLTSLLSR